MPLLKRANRKAAGPEPAECPVGPTIEEAPPKPWRKKRRPRAEAAMMGPVFAALALLLVCVLILVGFLFRPIW